MDRVVHLFSMIHGHLLIMTLRRLILDYLNLIVVFVNAGGATKVRLLLMLHSVLLAALAVYAVVSTVGHHLQVMSALLMFDVLVDALLAVASLTTSNHDLGGVLNATLANVL